MNLLNPPARHRTAVELAWMAAPFAFFLFVVQRLWSNAPSWDDYDAILSMLLTAEQLREPRAWFAMIFAQHNEHRIAVMRLAALALAHVTGQVDFRALMLLGALSLGGTLLFAWREFRGDVAAPIFGAAAVLLFQLSYYEALLMGSGALPHLGVVFFSFGCLYFACRDGIAAALAAVVLGLLAAGSQANGLLALPIAAFGAAAWRRWPRALFFAAAAALVWWLYFQGYHRPPHHPSPFVAFEQPFATFHLFCVNLGSILPGVRISALLGLAMLATAGWVVWKGGRKHPAVTLWILFLLASAGAAAVGRVGFGVMHVPRYALLSSALLVVLLLSVFRMRPAPVPLVTVATLVGAAAVALAASASIWPQVREYTLRPRLLAQTVVQGEATAEPYAGIFYPNQNRALHLLGMSSLRGYYRPPQRVLYAPRVVAAANPPKADRAYGHVDLIAVQGSRMRVAGWSGIGALVPDRTLVIATSPPFERAGKVGLVGRNDVAFALGLAEAVHSGFDVEVEFASPEAAQRAAERVCVVVEAPGVPAARLVTPPGRCPE